MKFRDVTRNEYDLTRQWHSDAERIKARVSRVVEWLGLLFNDKEQGGVIGLNFEPVDGEIICQIKSPAASGRLRLEFKLANDSLAAHVVVERDAVDVFGKACHQAVWAFYIPARGNGFVDPAGDSSRYVLDRGAGNALENSIFDLGASIGFALVAGPMVHSAA